MKRMKRTFFPGRRGPMITAIMGGQTPDELIAQSRGAEFDGAHGIAISLSDLKPEFRNRESFEKIVNSVNLPFMFYFYRDDCWKVACTDDARQEVLLCAAEAGAAMIDVMGDLYDPSPREITRDPEAINKQKGLIDRIHAKGAEVVISSHMNEALSAEQVLGHLKEFELRRADAVKIVTVINTEEEFSEAVRATMLLQRELKTPFIHLCNGSFGRLQRFISPALGVSIVFAVHRYDSRYPMSQPTIQAMKTVFENLHWHIDDLREKSGANT